MSEELLDFNAERVDRQMADLLEYVFSCFIPLPSPLLPLFNTGWMDWMDGGLCHTFHAIQYTSFSLAQHTY